MALIVVAQESGKPKIERLPAVYISPASGHQMYQNYCSSCHGQSGKGNGPAALALKTPPPDLTLLAKKHGGRFPSELVVSKLTGKQVLVAQEMPDWPKVFSELSRGRQAEVQLRIVNLNNYVASLQE